MPTETGLPLRRLGAFDVTVAGLGCNNFGGRVDAAGTRAVVDAAFELGVNFFDTADIYGGKGGSERFLGEALEGRRDEVLLATKFGMDMAGADGAPDLPRGSKAYIEHAVQASLRRLRTDWIDLYQYHEPDGVTPIEETLGALDELVRTGTVRAIGCSNFTAAQLEEADAVARERGWARFVCLQNEYSLLERSIEADVLPACERLGVGVLPYFPLASGRLTGKYRRGEAAPEGTRMHGRGEIAGDATFDRLEALARFADERSISPAEAAIGALLAKPAIASVIAGARDPEQLRANVRAADWRPSAEDLDALDAIFPPPRAAGAQP